MKKIELIYDASCPNIEKARERLAEALLSSNLTREWIEWDRANPKAPDYVRSYGSPTILVNGKDVAYVEGSTAADSCRLYRDGKGSVEGVPSLNDIREALTKQEPKMSTMSWLSTLAIFPAVAVSSLPFVSCPFCWPLYTSILGSLGLGFFDYTPYLFPITSLFLLVALASIWFQAKKAQIGFAPLWVACASTGGILVGKFLLPTLWILVPAALGLLAAAFLNLILVYRQNRGCC